MAWSSRPTVSTRMCRFLPLIFLPASYPCGSMHAPLFLRFSRAGFPLRAFATPFIERVVDSLQCAVIGPQIEVIVDRAFRWQVLRDRAPLTAGRENVHEAVHHLPHDHRPLATAGLARRDQRFDQSPFLVGRLEAMYGGATMAAVGSTRNSSKTMSDLHSAATRCGSKIVITYSDVIAGYNRGAGGAGCHIVVFELPSAPGVRETE